MVTLTKWKEFSRAFSVIFRCRKRLMTSQPPIFCGTVAANGAGYASQGDYYGHQGGHHQGHGFANVMLVFLHASGARLLSKVFEALLQDQQ